MQLFSWVAYAAAFLAAAALAWVLTPLMFRLAIRSGVLDQPGGHKSHTSPTPYLGGVAIVVAFSAAVLVAAMVYGPVAGLRELAIILGIGVSLALIGLADDLHGLSPWLRIGLQIAAGIAVWALGSGTTALGVEWGNAVLTVVWVVGITNALNLLDNMDGLSAGVATIAAATFFLIAILNGQFLVAGLAAALAGCASGFLRHNFHPARIYMGDAGSLFLGFMLAVLGVRLRLVDTPQFVAVFVPVLVLGVAIFDTTLVVVNRVRHGRSPLAGGRDHTSHRLVYLGVPVPVTVALIYGGAAALGWLALILTRVDAVTGLLLGIFVVLVGGFFMVLLSAVPVYENSRRRTAMVQVVRDHEPEPAVMPREQPTPAPEVATPGASSPNR